MNNLGHARIADFGLACLMKNSDSTGSISFHGAYTVGWTAPEVCDDGPKSKEGDMFAFAMVMIEVRRVRPSCARHWLTLIVY